MRRRACRLSMNLRHVLHGHRIHFYHTDPPSSISAITVVMPIYSRLDALLDSAGDSLFTAPDHQWRTTIQNIEEDFSRLDELWNDYMLTEKRALREQFLKLASRTQDLADHISALQATRMSNCAFSVRINIDKLVSLATIVRASTENLRSSCLCLVDSYPQADRF